MRRIDLVGQTYGQLKVVRKNGVRCGGQEWLCRCACGKEITVLGGNLRSGHTKSCGCLKANGKHSLTHGQTKTSLYNIWSHMKARATGKGGEETIKKYSGVTICDDWKTFANFYFWAKDKYKPNLQIDRINTLLGYYPENCRFVTQQQNMQNRKDGKLWVVDGIIFNSCSEASNVLGCSVATIKRRCDGRTSRGKHYPPFPNHYSIQKYPTENLCQ